MFLLHCNRITFLFTGSTVLTKLNKLVKKMFDRILLSFFRTFYSPLYQTCSKHNTWPQRKLFVSDFKISLKLLNDEMNILIYFTSSCQVFFTIFAHLKWVSTFFFKCVHYNCSLFTCYVLNYLHLITLYFNLILFKNNN